MSRSSTRILLAQHHPIYRLGVRTLLQQERDLEVVGEAVDGEQALALVAALRPNILLLEHALPVINGLRVLQRLSAQKSATRVIMLTAAMDEPDLRSALTSGA